MGTLNNILILSVVVLSCANGAFINFETTLGAIPEDSSLNTSWYNGGLLNKTFASLQPGDTLFIPNKTFWVMGGIQGQNFWNVTIQLDGTLSFIDDLDHWPRINGQVLECLNFTNISNVTFTSNGTGTLQGNGATWWGIPGIGYAIRGENRPRLFVLGYTNNILVENFFFWNSPYWTFWSYNSNGLEVRYSNILAKRNDYDGHDFDDLSAFNTDGFDVTGNNVWIHDCTVWNQDDCFCVKDGSSNMVFERISASGLGLTVGSISGTNVTNITFRDVYMPHTYKGIYMKFRAGDAPGLIADVLYENIYMDQPEQWPIWIGPAQQSDNADICLPNPCSLCWPEIPLAKCNLPAAGSYRNITLRNVTISDPQRRVGVIMANSTNPMINVVFDGVRVVDSTGKPKESEYFRCENVVGGIALGDTYPVPSCFQNNTTKSAIEQ